MFAILFPFHYNLAPSVARRTHKHSPGIIFWDTVIMDNTTILYYTYSIIEFDIW